MPFDRGFLVAGAAVALLSMGCARSHTGPHAGRADGGPRDAGSVDAGVRDAGAADARLRDGGAADAAAGDAGAADARPGDTGAPDAAGVVVAYSYNYCDCYGTTVMRRGEVFEIYNAPGGGPGPDIARCYLDLDGRLRAYNLDSTATEPEWGEAVETGCSAAVFSSYVVGCCFR